MEPPTLQNRISENVFWWVDVRVISADDSGVAKSYGLVQNSRREYTEHTFWYIIVRLSTSSSYNSLIGVPKSELVVQKSTREHTHRNF